MTKEQTAQQLELAAQILRTGHPFMASSKPTGLWCVPTQAEMNVLKWPVDKYEIRPVLATPPDNRPLHNPDNLTAEAVGVGYRLTLPGEKLDANYDYWLVEGGWKKGHGTGIASKLNPGAAMRLPFSVPWPEPADPYAELKAAHAAGKVIQGLIRGHWLDSPHPTWKYPVDTYRVKPDEPVVCAVVKPEPAFQLPPCAPGMRWHREDEWKADDLPSGYRPLAIREAQQKGDEFRGSGGWREISDVAAGDVTFSGYSHRRTTRPLVFNHAGKTWTYHRPGDPMPCEGERRVECVFVDHDIWNDTFLCAHEVNWGDDAGQGRIIGWRYADEKKTVPLGREDIRCGDEVQDSAGEARAILHVTRNGAFIYGLGFYSFEALQDCLKIRRRGSDAWEPCSKTIPAGENLAKPKSR